MVAISVRLPDEINTRLTALAKMTGRSKTIPLEEVMKHYDMED